MFYTSKNENPMREINGPLVGPRGGEGIEALCEQLLSFMSWNGNATQRQHSRHIGQPSHHNETLQTWRLKQLMFIFSVLEVGSPRSRCLWMWPGEGPFPDLQMAVFLLQMSSHRGGQREGKVLFSCKCEGHHEGSTFMTA